MIDPDELEITLWCWEHGITRDGEPLPSEPLPSGPSMGLFQQVPSTWGER